MTGVEILAIEEVVIDFAFSWNNFLILLGILFGLFIIIGIIMSLSNGLRGLLFFAILGTIFGSVFGIIAGFAMPIPTEYETQYKVVISDKVTMNEFYEKYEILDQDGKIYTVRERIIS